MSFLTVLSDMSRSMVGIKNNRFRVRRNVLTLTIKDCYQNKLLAKLAVYHIIRDHSWFLAPITLTEIVF